MLIGFYRSQEHLNWILENRLYNVRLGDRRGSLHGVELHITPSRIVLYSADCAETSIRIFTVNQSEVMLADKHKMLQLDYPASKNGIGESYKLFSLGEEIKNHRPIDINQLKHTYGRPHRQLCTIVCKILVSDAANTIILG